MGNSPSDPQVVKSNGSTVNGGPRPNPNQQRLPQQFQGQQKPPQQSQGPKRSPQHSQGQRATPSRRNRGFQEVQLESPRSNNNNNSPTQLNIRRTAQNQPAMTMRRENTLMLQQRVDERTSGRETDFHQMVHQGQVQQQAQRKEEFAQPEYEDDDDLVLETFYHRNGKVFSCVYQGKQRFYLDSWETQDWQPFPKRWYNEGILVTDRVLKNDPNQGHNSQSSSSERQQTVAPPSEEQNNLYNIGVQKNDREGFIDHPELGRISTYIYEEKRNVHYFYDKDTGQWIRMPVSWELRSELVQRLLLAVEEALPEWADQQDMLAALRGANYDPHDCIATYLAVQEKGLLPIPKTNEDAKLIAEKDDKIKKLQKKIDKLEKRLTKASRALQDEQENRKSAENMMAGLREHLAEMEVNYRSSRAQLESMQNERPKTARGDSPTPEEVHQSPVDSTTVLGLNDTAKELHRQYLQLKMDFQNRIVEMKPMMQETMVTITKMRLVDNDQSRELEDMRELYRKEALQRKLLYNKLQEMRGNIRVFCRCRFDDRVGCCVEFPSDIEVQAPGSRKMRFDRVFTPMSTQEDVFADTKPIITSCVDGYNVCIMAYGQTGSGKTHTMMGPPDDPGVNVRSIEELLKICNERENIDYTLKATMVEIYNETVQDLLSNDTKVLDVRANGANIIMPGITEMDIISLEDIEHVMDLGNKNRTVASTKMNSTSSRSHLLFMIKLEGQDRSSGSVSTGTLTLCDLAGSERVGKTEATGQRLVEAAAINKSLTALGQVFTALRTGQLHVPYRNSKLTHILQPCLGGDAKACLFAMVSPDENNVSETISTLHFGSNARQVQLGEAKKNVRKGGPSW